MAQISEVKWPEDVAFEAFAQWDTTFSVKRGKSGKPGIVEGYATSPEVDFCGDVLRPSAMTKHLNAFKDNPLYTYCHNTMTPIGTCVEVALDEKGLRYVAEVIDDPRHPLAQLALCLLENGTVRKSSIGYDVYKQKFQTGEDGRRLRILEEIRIHEIAAVPLAMNEATSADLRKAWGLHMGPQGDEAEVISLVGADAEWPDVSAAMTTLLGDRGGIDLTPSEKRIAYEDLAKRYVEHELQTPTFKGTDVGVILAREMGDWCPPYSEIEFREGERKAAEASRIADSVKTIHGRAEGLANIVSANTGDGVLSVAEGGVLSPEQLESVGVAHGCLAQVLDAHKPATETAKGVPSREEWLAACRATGSTDPAQAIRDARAMLTA